MRFKYWKMTSNSFLVNCLGYFWCLAGKKKIRYLCTCKILFPYSIFFFVHSCPYFWCSYFFQTRLSCITWASFFYFFIFLFIKAAFFSPSSSNLPLAKSKFPFRVSFVSVIGVYHLFPSSVARIDQHRAGVVVQDGVMGWEVNGVGCI